MSFTNPFEVSTNGKTPENVKIKLKPSTFINAETLEAVEGEFTVQLPKQFGSETQKIIVESLGTAFIALMAATMGLAFLLQFWEKSFLYRFWPLYFTVQLLCTLVILEINVPTNVDSILSSIKDVIELNFARRDVMLEVYADAPAS